MDNCENKMLNDFNGYFQSSTNRFFKNSNNRVHFLFHKDKLYGFSVNYSFARPLPISDFSTKAV